MTVDAIAPFPPLPLSALDRFAKRLITAQLNKLQRGQIQLSDGQGTILLGSASDVRASIQVNHPRFYRSVLAGGTLSVAESYLQGDWDCGDLTTLFRVFVRNLDRADRLDSGLATLVGLSHRLHHWWRSNTHRGSRRNISAHYDLGNSFFRLWLDETMAYSCGVFLNPDSTLQQASEEKFDRACRKLDLGPDDHLLEIGTGWGGLAIHAAMNYGCRVTTTTISKEQAAIARKRIDDAGLSHRITLLQQDYRDLEGKFDKLVSIEMIEAVGRRYFDAYFRKLGELLKPDGTALLQAIVMPERRYEQYLKGVDFIQKYIFPGGCLPSVATMLGSAGRVTDLRFVHAEDFAPHYAQTLRCWRQAFRDQVDEVRRQGYSEEFIRLWTYYLCYCEAVFEERHVGLVQIQFDKPRCRRDPMLLSNRAAQQDQRSPGHRFEHCSEQTCEVCV